jgi:hypothetical protein
MAGTFPGRALKVFVVLAAAMSLAGCEALWGTPNVFRLPVARVYDKLSAVAIKPSGTGPFGRLEIETSGRRYQYVEWTLKEDQAGPLCVASLTPLEAEKTRVDISCKAFGDGAESGLVALMIRRRVIELVDATLRDRPFDARKADNGVTAAFWPKDVIDHGNLGTAAGKALEMERQMALELHKWNSSGNR